MKEVGFVSAALSAADLKTPVGKQLHRKILQITEDGELGAAQLRTLLKWLQEQQGETPQCLRDLREKIDACLTNGIPPYKDRGALYDLVVSALPQDDRLNRARHVHNNRGAAKEASPHLRQAMPVAWMVILVALAAGVGFMFSAQQELARYRISIILLVFALSTVSALVFSARVHFKTVFGATTLLLGGPAALWVGTLIVLQTLFPEKAIAAHTDPEKLVVDSVSSTERDNGWLEYGSWLPNIGKLRRGIQGDESYFLQKLLVTAHYDGRRGRARTRSGNLLQPKVDTLFLFLVDSQMTVKIQRIRGRADVDESYVPYRAQASKRDNKPRSALFWCTTKTLTLDHHRDEGNGWAKAADKDVDAIVVALYDDWGEYGDYVMTDTRKYAAPDEKLKTRLAIISTGEGAHQIDNLQIAEFKGPRLARQSEIPLVFRTNAGSPYSGDQAISMLSVSLKDCLKALDLHLDGDCDESVKELLQTILNTIQLEMQSKTFEGILESQDTKRVRSFEASTENPLITTFSWRTRQPAKLR